jgi:CPA1 family monovalent cation:H+ antiporter
LKIEDESAHDKEQEQEFAIRKTMAETSLKFLEQGNSNKHELNEHLRNLSAKLRTDLSVFRQDLGKFNMESKEALVEYQETYIALLEEQRKALRKLNSDDVYDEALIRKYLAIIDLEETKLREVAVVQ